MELKFGEYLLKKGKIIKSELEKALKFQTESLVILGEQSINANVLNKEQVSAILDHHRVQGGFFGDIAVKLGFLNKDDFDNRLEIRNRENFLIGKILVSHGTISEEDMEQEWKQFLHRRTSLEIKKGWTKRELLD